MNELEAAALQQSMWRVSGSLTQQIEANGKLTVAFKAVCEDNGRLQERCEKLFRFALAASILASVELFLLIWSHIPK